MDSESTDMSSRSDQPGRPFMVNSGPSMGKEIQLPIGVELGRKFLRGVLSDTGYQRLLPRFPVSICDCTRWKMVHLALKISGQRMGHT